MFSKTQTLQTTFQNRVEMQCKRRYKICICSVVLGELGSFRNYKGFGITFPKVFFICNSTERIAKVRIFLIPLSITFSNPKVLGFLFCKKNSVTWQWNVKIKLQKIVGNLLDNRRTVTSTVQINSATPKEMFCMCYGVWINL